MRGVARRPLVLVAALFGLLLTVALSGCLRSDLDSKVVNQTGAPQAVQVQLFSLPDETRLFDATFTLAGGDSLALDDFPPHPGLYKVEVQVEGGPRGTYELEWSRAEGPDAFRIEIKEGGISFGESVG